MDLWSHDLRYFEVGTVHHDFQGYQDENAKFSIKLYKAHVQADPALSLNFFKSKLKTIY